MIESNIQ